MLFSGLVFFPIRRCYQCTSATIPSTGTISAASTVTATKRTVSNSCECVQMMCQHEKHVKTIQSAFVGITARNPICRRVNRMRAKKNNPLE